VLVRGKGNHSAAPASFEFKIAAQVIDLNGHTFEVPRVVGEFEGERTLRDLLAGGPSAPVRTALADQVAALITDQEQRGADLARQVGRERTDGSFRRALKQLEDEGRAVKGANGWHLPDVPDHRGVPVPPLIRVARHSSAGPAGAQQKFVCECADGGAEPLDDGRCSRCFGALGEA
jgi:hypothetical protein